jgi:hypothetical protein
MVNKAEKELQEAKRLTPQEWSEMARLGHRQRRLLEDAHSQLQRQVAQIGDEYAEFRDRIRNVFLPGLKDDVDEVRRLTRKAELYAEYSAKAADDHGKNRSRQTTSRHERSQT